MAQKSVAQFALDYDGKAVDFDKQYGMQCVDLFNFYNSEVVGAPWIGTPRTNGARDLYECASEARDKFYEILPAPVEIKTGDVLVWAEPYGRSQEGNTVKFYGHVAIAIDGGRMIQQNGRISQKTTIDPITPKFMIGILRPRSLTASVAPQNDPTTVAVKNKHTIQKGDTFWGLEESLNIPHGSLQIANPSLDARKLQIGTEIILPCAAPATQSPPQEFYDIRAGDTFWALEDAWQLGHGTLQQLNPELDPRKLQIGGRIRKS